MFEIVFSGGNRSLPELEERDRLVEVLQPVLAQLGDGRRRRAPASPPRPRPAAVPARGDPRGPVQLAPGVALAGQPQLAGVQAHPHLDRPRRERLLPRAAAATRLDGSANTYRNASPCVSTSTPPWRGERAPQETAVLRQRADVAVLAELLDQPRRALDVGEEQGDGPGREPRPVIPSNRRALPLGLSSDGHMIKNAGILV